jgi:hypothetical protein
MLRAALCIVISLPDSGHRYALVGVGDRRPFAAVSSHTLFGTRRTRRDRVLASAETALYQLSRCSVCWQALMRWLSTPGRQQWCVEVGAALWTEVKIPPDSIVIAPAEVKGALWAAQCVTDRRAEGYEYAEDH